MIILWDLHEVVFHRNKNDWIKAFFYFKKKKAVLGNLSFKITSLLTQFILVKCKLSKKEVTSEELLLHARNANNHALVELIHQFSSHYQPNLNVTALIKDLHAHGYTQHIGSNIGPTLLETLHQQFPEIMACFSYAHVVTCTQNQKTIKKPDPLFFKTYLDAIKIPAHEIVFIDDRAQNISSAKKIGMHGILFKDAKTLACNLNSVLNKNSLRS